MLLLGASCAPATPSLAPGGGSEPRNLLLVTVDTLRTDHLGAYGYPRGTSPRIDALAHESVVFERAYASSSWTLPTLASLHTSHLVSTHRASRDRTRVSERFETLAECLERAGFRTGAVATHIYLDRRYGLDQGFQDYDDDLLQAEDTHKTISSPSVTDKGIAWISEREAAVDERWFLWLHYFDPHHVFLPHEGISERFGLTAPEDLYDGEIAFTDLHIGRLLDELDARGLSDETVVALLADHGEEFGDHGRMGHRLTLYDEVVRVPMMIRVPGVLPARVSSAVPTVGLMPTFLELLDVAPPERLGAESLVPTFTEEATDRDILAETQERGNDRDIFVRGSWKLLRDRTDDEVKLFDLRVDPGELVDLAGTRSDKVSALLGGMRALQRRLREAASDFGGAAPLELTGDDLETLRSLGYLGDDGEVSGGGD